tara:strand:- start:102 stop:317 length:216 start_codon:yes stop_codon:yes gene_type:complete
MRKIKLDEDIVLKSMEHLNNAVEWNKFEEYKLAYKEIIKAYNYKSIETDLLLKIIQENNLEDKLLEKGLEY